MSELITSFDSKTKTILQLSKESTYLELPEYYNDVEINIIGEGAGYSGKYEIVDLTNSKIPLPFVRYKNFYFLVA